MAQHELNPETMARLVDSSAWQHYLRQCLLPSWKLAVEHYSQVKDDHRFWQAWMLALQHYIELPYQKAGRRSPLELRGDVESAPVAPPAPVEEKPAEVPPVRPLRHSTFPV